MRSDAFHLGLLGHVFVRRKERSEGVGGSTGCAGGEIHPTDLGKTEQTIGAVRFNFITTSLRACVVITNWKKSMDLYS